MPTRRHRHRRRPRRSAALLVTGTLLAGGVAALGSAGPAGLTADLTGGLLATASSGEAAARTATSSVTDDFHPAAYPALAYADEFDGTALDRGSWCTRYQYGGGAPLQPGFEDAACGRNGAGTRDMLNDEEQRFRDVTAAGQRLHTVQGGHLSLHAYRTQGGQRAFGRYSYDAGMIRSKRLFRPSADESFYLTARVRLPDVRGSWPAFWLMPFDGWPPELDILEGQLNEDGSKGGERRDMLNLGAHGKAAGRETYRHPELYQGTQYPRFHAKDGANIRGRWFEMGFEWTAGSACWYFDGTKVLCRQSSWTSDSGALAQASPVVLNLAVGGHWAGENGVDDSRLPMTFDVDHVRVWSSKGGPAAPPATTPPGTQPSQPGTPPQPGAGTLRGAGSGRCLTAPAEDATAATIRDCAGQTWTYTAAGELRSADGRCLDALGAKTGSGTPVGMWPCHGRANQRWTRTADGSLTGAASSRCLDVAGARTAAGSPVQLWDCHGGGNQRWTLTAAAADPKPADPKPADPKPADPPAAGARQALSGVGYADPKAWGEWRGQAVSSIDTWNDAKDESGRVTWAKMLPLYSADDLRKKLPELNAVLQRERNDPEARVTLSIAQPMFAQDESYSSCAKGSAPSDSRIAEMARALAGVDPRAFVRLNWEFNSGYHWKVKPSDAADFRACWKRWHAALKQASPTLKAVWNPNSDQSWEWRVDDFWPGAQYVDAAGPDLYGKADKGKLASPDQWTGGFSDARGEIRNPRGINAWASYVAGKGVPLAVPEWGVHNSADDWSSHDPEYVRQMRRAFEKAAASPTGLAYEDYFDGSTGYGCMHSIHSPSCTKNPDAAAVYAHLWRTPYATS